MTSATIRPRDRDAIMSALRAGVVPRIGLQHIQVGRSREIEALLGDVERIADGGATFRFVIGEYGSGKTFFLSLVRQIALQKKLAVAQADLAPDRRIHATGGQARLLYAELAKSISTRAAPDGGGLKAMIEGHVHKMSEAAQAGGATVDAMISKSLAPLREMVFGHDFATVIVRYARAFEEGDDATQAAALRWLRGEYTTKTEAREHLGVRTIIDDGGVYDALRLLARFSRIAGQAGLLVCLDELVNLYKLQSAQARRQNYEQILRMLNDVLQGATEGLGLLLGGTPDFLFDTRRGLFSYEALQSRLAANSFAADGMVDYSGPVIRLAHLTREELLHLLERLRHVHAVGAQGLEPLPDEALTAFMEHCEKRIGEAYFRTPRTTIKAFLDLLAILGQNAGADWRVLLGAVDIGPDAPPASGDEDATLGADSPDDELASLKL